MSENIEENIEEYTKDEIKEFIKNKENLYFAESDAWYTMVREEDIPDFIIWANNMELKLDQKLVDIQFYNSKNPAQLVLSTYGTFLNKAEPELREKIVDRLVKLQTNEMKPKKIKLIDGNLFIETDKEVGLLHDRELERKALIIGTWNYDDEKIKCNAIILKENKPVANIIDSFDIKEVENEEYKFSKKLLEEKIIDNCYKYENLPKLSETSNLMQDIYNEVSSNESEMAFIDDVLWNSEFKNKYTDNDIENLKTEAKKLRLEDVITFNQDDCKIIAYSDLANKFNDDRNLERDYETYKKYQKKKNREAR